MVLHSTLTGSDLHIPLGSNGNALNLTDNISDAIRWINGTTARRIHIVQTTTGTKEIAWGDAADDWFYTFDGTGNFGIGIGGHAADSKFHVFKSDAAITADASSVATFESSANSYLTIGSGAANAGGLIFARSGNNTAGSILYDHALDALKVSALGSTATAAFYVSSHTMGNPAVINESDRKQTVRFTTTNGAPTGTLWSQTIPEHAFGTVAARISASNGTNGATYLVTQGVRRFAGGSTALVGTMQTIAIIEESAIAADFAVSFDLSSNDLRLRVTQGAQALGTTWGASVEMQLMFI